MASEQTFKNHTRFVPAYHIGVLLPFLANFVWCSFRFVKNGSSDNGMALLMSLALLLMFFSVRGQILRVQDRVIRLEMALRLQRLLPADLAAQAAALPVSQLVALRFAADAELPDLVRDVVGGGLHAPKQIKLRVKEWQGDHLRA